MNMSRLIRMFLSFCLIFLFLSCSINEKDSYLESFENFIVDIETEKTISAEDITSIKKKYLDYTETYYYKYENELSIEEKETIIELKTRYYVVMTKQGLKDFGHILKDLGEYASEFIDEVLE